MTEPQESGSERIPRCEECGVKHPWIRSLNPMVRAVNFECNECGRQQTRTIHTGGDDDGIRTDGGVEHWTRESDLHGEVFEARCPSCGSVCSSISDQETVIRGAQECCDDGLRTDGGKPHCGRIHPNPWWTNVTSETAIALYEGAKDARRLKEVLDDGRAR